MVAEFGIDPGDDRLPRSRDHDRRQHGHPAERRHARSAGHRGASATCWRSSDCGSQSPVNFTATRPLPLIPRYRVGEVSERYLADGSEDTPLDKDELIRRPAA